MQPILFIDRDGTIIQETDDEKIETIEKLKKAKPDIKFSSEFIIGYPGETKDDFAKTVQLMEKVGFISSYSFIYSARPGTPAFNLKKIDQEDTKTRLIQFQKLADKIKINYRKNLVNKITSTLFENKIKNGGEYCKYTKASVIHRYLYMDFEDNLQRDYNVVYVDEVSQLTEHQKNKLFSIKNTKFIFMGDIGYQLEQIIYYKYLKKFKYKLKEKIDIKEKDYLKIIN